MELRSSLLRQRPRQIRASAFAILAALLLLLALGPFHCSSQGLDVVELTLLAGAHDKGAGTSISFNSILYAYQPCSHAIEPYMNRIDQSISVCLDGSPAGYHLQTGSGTGLQNWIIHLQGGGWCSTIQSCSNRRMGELGSSNFMKAMSFSGILSNDQQRNPDFYNWNRVYVRYCDGASFAGDSQLEDQSGNKLFFRGLRIWEAVIAELMEKGLAHSKQALLTGCSAGGLATFLHCDDFRGRFPPNVSVKCLPDAGFFLDAKDLSGQRSMWSVYNGVVHLQNVTNVLPNDCLANKDPTECFFPAELIKSIKTPTFILNSAYDSWQIRNVVAPDGSYHDNSWLSCKSDIQNCSPAQIQVLHGFRNAMLNELKVVEENMEWAWFIDSCFTHCQTIYDISWNTPASPRLGNKTVSEAVGDWYFGNQSVVVREVDCEYPCNPTCNTQLPTIALTNLQ